MTNTGAVPAAPRIRPSAVTVSFTLWLVLAALPSLGLLVQLLLHLQTLASAALLTALLAGFVFLAFKMRAGARWARSILTLLAVLNWLGIAILTIRYGPRFLFPPNPISSMVILGELAMEVFATIAMNVPTARWYFHTKR